MRYLNGQDFHNCVRTPSEMRFTDRGYPILEPIYDIPDDIELLGWNYVNSKKHEMWKWIHFFMEDYLFNSVWNSPDRMMEKLESFSGVLSPDFSMFYDTPYPIQCYNFYRSMWCGAYWQLNGLKVIPNVCWSDDPSLDFVFESYPKNSVVAVSMIGCTKDPIGRGIFLRGYDRMLQELNPSKILLLASDAQRKMVDGPIQHIRYSFMKEREE